MHYCLGGTLLCVSAVPPMMGQARVGEINLGEVVQSVVEKHPLIRYQQAQTEIDRGLKLQASGAFDTILTAGLSQSRTTTPLTSAEQEEYALIGVQGANERTDLTQVVLGASRLFRSGISVNGTTTVTRNVDNILDPLGVNASNPNVQVTIPLLRDRGQDAVAAQERAAETEVNASNYDLTNQISTLVTTAVDDYWNLIADEKLLQIAKEAESRAATDLDNTRTLVDADRLPRENLNEVNANVSQSASARIAAEQNRIAAQYQLAADIGMDRQAIASTVLISSDSFPNIESAEFPAYTMEELQGYVNGALDERSDFIALNVRISEQKLLVTAAKNHLLPELTVTASGGYNGLQEGRRFKDIFTSLGGNISGPNASAGINYNFPLRNEAARGAYIQAVATQTQMESQSLQLSHTIASAVINAAQAVRNAALQVNKARAAVTFYRASLTGQREKYHLGMASVVDVLTVENSLTTALTTEVQAELSYAQALTQFRYATGTIIPPGKTVTVINPNVFRTLPLTNPSVSKP